MGLQRPQRSTFHDLPTPPPSTPLSVTPLPPLASTVNIHITNHNHYNIHTPPSTQRKVLGSKSRAALLSSTTVSSKKAGYKSPLLQKIIQNLSPIYNYLTPAATPVITPSRRVTSISFTEGGEDTTWVDEEDFEDDETVIDEQLNHIVSVLDDMPKEPVVRFSAAATNRTCRRHVESDDEDVSPFPTSSLDELETEPEHMEICTPTKAVQQTGTVTIKSALRGAGNSSAKKKKSQKVKFPLPECYDHDLRFPDQPSGCDVVPCDWVRRYNSQRFNNYSAAYVQCKVPKCDICIAHETYGENSVWARSAPPGHTAESHRLRSRIRYLCRKCPQPAPQPPGGIGPIEMCTCTLRDEKGVPTDMWFQCKDCAESAWFEFDSKFGGPDGFIAKPRRPMTRKNKLGVIVRPRRSTRTKSSAPQARRKRCGCGSFAPVDGRYGAYCTWCNCPVEGRDMMEYGGAATRSGKSFTSSREGVPYAVKDDVVMIDGDNDSGIGF
ncbi:hypothetical protein TWF694_004483 [Orbilia ellipsospora]|uniref:Uncharacterized protein n=1 Tax=Orbilia ellipsospora TaxID=2528407 RepID=A0AAV9WXH2_9PEZI